MKPPCYTVHLYADIDYSGPAGPDIVLQYWFHKKILLPFMPMKDMHLYMGFEPTEEGEIPNASIVSVNWNVVELGELEYLWCHVKIFAKCDFRKIDFGIIEAKNWYIKHGWNAHGAELPVFAQMKANFANLSFNSWSASIALVIRCCSTFS